MSTNIAIYPNQSILDALTKLDYKKAEQLSIFHLGENPLEPQLWLYLCEALLQQGYGASAYKTFERAWMLDPQGSWLESVKHRFRHTSGQRNKKSIEKLLQVKPVKVAAGVIVKDEERSIHRCLSSLVDAVDEIIVVDTGSTDGTLDIVRSFPNVKIVEFAWCDDFSAARNAGLEQMESDWVLWVDADEYLFPDDIQNVRIAAGLYDEFEPTAILRVGIYNQIHQSVSVNYNVVRMFPLRRNLRFWGRIHEQIGHSDGIHAIPFYIPAVRVRLHHDGYEPSVVQMKNKMDRNLRLLQQMVDENPDDPTWLLFLGRETFLLKKDVEKAIELLLQAEEKARDLDWFGAKLDIYRLLVEAFLAKSNFHMAEDMCQRALTVDPNFPDARYYLSFIQLQQALGLFKSAEQNIIKAKDSFHQYKGKVTPDHQILDWKADLVLGDIYLLSGNLHKAMPIYQSLIKKYPNLDAAKKQLQAIETIRKLLNS
jgi:glycosyltransferase involved in cell wall biosynthesis